jgi:hypothetical protein
LIRIIDTECGRERLVVVGWADTPQPQYLLRAFESVVLSHPPRNQLK